MKEERSESVHKDFNGMNLTRCPLFEKMKEFTSISLKYNKISSLSSFPALPNLRNLFLDSNFIETFESTVSQPKLRAVSLVGNPVSSEKHIGIMCYIVFGDRVRSVNGSFLSTEEIKFGKLNRPELLGLLTSGYILKSIDPITLENKEAKKQITLKSAKKAIKKRKKCQSLSSPAKICFHNMPKEKSKVEEITHVVYQKQNAPPLMRIGEAGTLSDMHDDLISIVEPKIKYQATLPKLKLPDFKLSPPGSATIFRRTKMIDAKKQTEYKNLIDIVSQQIKMPHEGDKHNTKRAFFRNEDKIDNEEEEELSLVYPKETYDELQTLCPKDQDLCTKVSNHSRTKTKHSKEVEQMTMDANLTLMTFEDFTPKKKSRRAPPKLNLSPVASIDESETIEETHEFDTAEIYDAFYTKHMNKITTPEEADYFVSTFKHHHRSHV